MKTYDIVTLTVSPALDKSAHFAGLVPELKIRCHSELFDAGGGGVNVSKAISRLEGISLAVLTAGGPTGEMLKKILKEELVPYKAIETETWTRENFVAVDDNTNSQYRFVFPAPSVNALEKEKINETIKGLDFKFLVISGGLSEGLPDDFYKKIAQDINKTSSRIIMDTTGEGLKKALEAGVYLIKPNVGELAKLLGVERLEMGEVNSAAREIIDKGGAEIVVVSLGSQGAVLVTKDSHEYVPAPNVVKRSTVGAGDSMVGGMVWALAQDKPLKEVIRWGVACGSAATMNEGTRLFKKEDAFRLFEWLKEK